MKVSRRFKISNSISIGQLLGVGFLASLLMVIVYARSIYFAYVFLSFAIMFFVYIKFIKNYYRIDKNCRLLITIVWGISIINSILNGDIKSNLMLNTSLLLAFVISTMNVKFVKVVRGLMLCGLLVVPCVFLQVEFNLFGDINSNTFSFLAYMGISLSFIWFKCADKKISPIMCMIVGYYCILRTGSRNVAIVVLICFALLLIPRRIWERAWFFRCVYILAIVYTIMAVYIMEVGFDNSAISDLLNDFVDSFSDKAWEMEGRVDFLLEIQLKLRNKGIVEQLLGSGIAKHHGHNLFYQSVFAYGYLGTLLIYITYVIMFEMAYKIIRMQNDSFVLGSVIIMVGHFLIQGADVYMLGTEGCIVMPAVIMGLIMQQYREKFILHRNVLEASINICK